MKSFFRFVPLLLAAAVLFGCTTSEAAPRPVASAPTLSATIPVLVAGTTPSPSPFPTSAPTPTSVPANSTSTNTGYTPADSERQAADDLRAAKVIRPDATASSATVTLASKPTNPLNSTELYVHLPLQVKSEQPSRVFLVLHGMGNRGDTFSQNLIKIAERNNWVLIAPTFQYHDYLDPQQLMEDDIQMSRRLADTLDVLPQRLNLKLYKQILIFGFSRGAQLGHRFAYFYPERVKSVAALSAGAYTLPTEKTSNAKGTQVVPFPYGVGNLQECVGKPINWEALKQISFWVGVGERDNQPLDVARAFDAYGGRTRVERAQAFKQALQNIGVDVYLNIFPNTSHEETLEMRDGALRFLREEELADPLDD